MEVSREQILRRMTELKIKVEERLRLCHGDRVTPHVYATFRKDILEYIHEMEVCITKLELSQTPETDVLETEVSWASQLMEYHIELGGLDDSLAVPTASSSMDTSTSTSGRSSASFIVKPPQIQIPGPTFGGSEMATDHMNFLSRFENWVVGMANDAERLNFLKCSLTDRALRLINHLSYTNTNYQRALSLLKKEYLNIDEIIDQIFQDILDYIPKKEIFYLEFGEFISRTASLLEELGNTYSSDFSEDNSGGARLMAKILFLKFPKELKGEMIGLTGRRIPSLSSILELTGGAIKQLQVKVGTSANSSFDTGRNSSQGVARRPKSTSSFHIGAGPQRLPGYSRSLPPILFVTFIKGKKSVAVNCLLDTGSGRSYLSAEVLRGLGSIETIGMNCQIRLSTLLGECDLTFKEVALEIDLGCGNPVTSHVLAAESIDLSVRLTNLEPLLNAFQDAKCSLAGKFETGSDFIPIKVIIGLDLLHQLGPCQLVPCLKGWAFSTPAGVVPFGAVESFFSEDQTPHEVAHLSFNSVMTQSPQVKSSHLFFLVLKSQPSYLDPLAEFFPDSEVQRGLEQVFNLESLGIHDKNHFSD